MISNKWDDSKGKCAVSGVKMTHHRDGSGKGYLQMFLLIE